MYSDAVWVPPWDESELAMSIGNLDSVAISYERCNPNSHLNGDERAEKRSDVQWFQIFEHQCKKQGGQQKLDSFT